MNLQIVLSAPKNLYLNQAAPKNTCQNFRTQKNPQIENFKAKKVLWSSLSLEIQSTPTPAPCGGCSTMSPRVSWFCQPKIEFFPTIID